MRPATVAVTRASDERPFVKRIPHALAATSAVDGKLSAPLENGVTAGRLTMAHAPGDDRPRNSNP